MGILIFAARQQCWVSDRPHRGCTYTASAPSRSSLSISHSPSSASPSVYPSLFGVHTFTFPVCYFACCASLSVRVHLCVCVCASKNVFAFSSIFSTVDCGSPRGDPIPNPTPTAIPTLSLETLNSSAHSLYFAPHSSLSSPHSIHSHSPLLHLISSILQGLIPVLR